MVDITNNVITIVQGDTLEVPIVIRTMDGSEFVPFDDDEIRFAVKEEHGANNPVLIRKLIPTDTMILRLEANETKNLQARKKLYVYDVELSTVDGYVDTFIRSHIRVLEEVD